MISLKNLSFPKRSYLNLFEEISKITFLTVIAIIVKSLFRTCFVNIVRQKLVLRFFYLFNVMVVTTLDSDLR